MGAGRQHDTTCMSARTGFCRVPWAFRYVFGAHQRANGALLDVIGSREIAARAEAGASELENRNDHALSGSRRVNPAWRRPPPRLAAAREHFDDDHASATAWARAGQHPWRVRLAILRLLRIGGRLGDTKESASRSDVVSAVGVGEEPVVADAVEALGQHVQEEAPDELVRVKLHRLPAAWAVDA